jgi:hypothetical protein
VLVAAWCYAGVMRYPDGGGLTAAERALCRAKTNRWSLSWRFICCQAALRYSLIRPPTACLCSILAVTSMTWPGSCNGGLCCRA